MSLEKFFAYVQLFVGVFFLVLILTEVGFFVSFTLNSAESLNTFINSALKNATNYDLFIFYGLVANFLLMLIGFKSILVILSLILIMNAILDIKED